MNDLAILVPSCDKFQDVWPHFFHFLFKYWPNCKHKIYLISNDNLYNDSRVTPICIQSEKSWSDNIVMALNKINENYILMVLEDFLFMGAVDETYLNQLLGIMKQEDAGYFRLMANPPSDIKHPFYTGIGYLKKEASYRTSLQVAFWEKKCLLDLLVSGETPWEFELKGTQRSRDYPKPFLSIDGIKQPIGYFPNAIVRGRWVTDAVHYLKSHERSLIGNRLVETFYQVWLRNSKIRHGISKWIIQPLRKMLTS